MTDGRSFGTAAVYEFSVQGDLEPRWSGWFGGLTVAQQGDDVTVLHGPVADQSALHVLLAKIRDLGLPLLSVKRQEQ